MTQGRNGKVALEALIDPQRPVHYIYDHRSDMQ